MKQLLITLSFLSTVALTACGGGGSTQAPQSALASAQVAQVTVATTTYGNDPLETADIYTPPGASQGVVLWIHGGGWNGGDKSDNSADALEISQAGYTVVNMNYRLVPVISDADVLADAMTVLDLLMNQGNGNKFNNAQWQQVNATVTAKGLCVGGVSAGGHMAVYSVMAYQAQTGLYPIKGVASIVGPMDLDYLDAELASDSTLSSFARGWIDNLVGSTNNEDAMKLASPRWQYGTNANPGRWHSSVQASALNFYFYTNLNDTLAIPATIEPFVATLQSELGSTRVHNFTVSQGVVKDGVVSHNLTVTVGDVMLADANMVWGR